MNISPSSSSSDLQTTMLSVSTLQRSGPTGTDSYSPPQDTSTISDAAYAAYNASQSPSSTLVAFGGSGSDTLSPSGGSSITLDGGSGSGPLVPSSPSGGSSVTL